MKKIAITQRLIQNSSYFEIRECLDINYFKLLQECGFLPIILSSKIDIQTYFKTLNIEGLFLSGGNDLNSCNSNFLSKKRDKFEIKLISYCIENNLPIFGTCRGMQIIAQYFGSSFKKVKNQIDIKHKLNLKEDSSYVNLNNLKKVNSFHNFAIDTLAKDLKVLATNKEGLIKAVEHKKHKIFAQMWHSERNKPFKKEEITVIKDFFND